MDFLHHAMRSMGVRAASGELRARAVRHGWKAAAWALLVLTLGLGGCYERTVFDSMDQWRKLANGGGHAVAEGGTIDRKAWAEHHHNAWAVQVGEFYGRGRSERAAKLVGQMKDRDGLDDVWLQGEGSIVRVLYGKFDTPNEAKAHEAKARIRELAKQEPEPYQDAQIVGVTTQGKTYSDPANLKAYHDQYTLQIGFYTGDDREQKAKDAAHSLRDRGEEAFFYNGPNRSMVTVGLFTREAAFVSRRDPISPANSETYVQAYSKTIDALQKRFPYNRRNGHKIEQTIHGKKAGEQQSFLVHVP